MKRLFIIKDINNREDKRKVQREYHKTIKGFDEIETYFIKTAINQGLEGFKDVYSFFNKEWVNHCKRVNNRKLLYTLPNEDYFKLRYENFDKVFKSVFKDKKDGEQLQEDR